MIGITAILYTHNDALRIARAVESLRCCDEVLVVDHASSDDTCRIARAFGARVVATKRGSPTIDPPGQATHDWIFNVSSDEVVSEALEASLLEWKMGMTPSQDAVAISLLEETSEGWMSHPPQPRLWDRTRGPLPEGWTPEAIGKLTILDGPLTRLRLP